jgi:hypothetical protein
MRIIRLGMVEELVTIGWLPPPRSGGIGWPFRSTIKVVSL